MKRKWVSTVEIDHAYGMFIQEHNKGVYDFQREIDVIVDLMIDLQQG